MLDNRRQHRGSKRGRTAAIRDCRSKLKHPPGGESAENKNQSAPEVEVVEDGPPAALAAEVPTAAAAAAESPMHPEWQRSRLMSTAQKGGHNNPKIRQTTLKTPFCQSLTTHQHLQQRRQRQIRQSWRRRRRTRQRQRRQQSLLRGVKTITFASI